MAHIVKALVFPVVMYGYESWTIKKAERLRIDAFKLMLEKTLESSLDCKEIKPVNSEGNQPWIFIGRTDAKLEAPVLWPPNVKSQLIEKDPDAGKDWRQEEKGTTEDEMVEWHHWFNGYEFEQTPGDVEPQGILVCCIPWSHKSWTRLSDLTTNSGFKQRFYREAIHLKEFLLFINCMTFDRLLKLNSLHFLICKTET